MTTLFVRRLTVVDASVLDTRQGLLGESWLVDVELDGILDHQGMVLDFARVKRQIKQIIDLHFDHKLLLPAKHPDCRISSNNQRSIVELTMESGAIIQHSAPDDATTLIAGVEVDPEHLEAAILNRITPSLPANIQQVRLRVYPESIEGPWYRYSHGLKHHDGNCQRIAHGHRSGIRIFKDDQESPSLEQEWSERWRDIYLGTREDLEASFETDGMDYYRFGYTAGQGRFELTLPADSCYLVDCDSTVENLAQHIAETLNRENPHSRFRVMAFEGVDKGAFGIA
ncbi:MAG: hypothetical protein GY703_10335 [Gammaproteobacteria bacterium]|nr:hypothetical protein [Gammaproteobacteria bacterium]